MDPSPPALSLLLTLVLGFTQANDQVDYCQGICPDFTRISTNGKYEVRQYEASVWLCTGVESTGMSAVYAARERLKQFQSQQRDKGVVISSDTWPGMVSVKQVDGVEEYEMCWFIPPGLTLSSQVFIPSVRVEPIPQTTMFVRSFTGTPSIDLGRENAQGLKVDLDAAGENYNHTIYYGVAYDPYFSFSHHDEIWIPKAS